MPSIKEINGKYYLCSVHRRRKGTREHKKLFFKHIFLVKYCGNIEGDSGMLGITKQCVHCPKELVGKRIMLKVVEVKD